MDDKGHMLFAFRVMVDMELLLSVQGGDKWLCVKVISDRSHLCASVNNNDLCVSRDVLADAKSGGQME